MRICFPILSVLVIASMLAAGCQQTTANNTKKTGSYTAARRNTLGSHIPQAYSADSVDSTFDPEAWSQFQSRQSIIASKIAGGGGPGSH